MLFSQEFKPGQRTHPRALWGIITNHRSPAAVVDSYWTLQPQSTPLVRAAIFGTCVGANQRRAWSDGLAPFFEAAFLAGLLGE